MKNYYRLALSALFLFFSLSVVGPNLISAKSDILFMSGILYIVLVVPTVLYYLNEKMIENLLNDKKD